MTTQTIIMLRFRMVTPPTSGTMTEILLDSKSETPKFNVGSKVATRVVTCTVAVDAVSVVTVVVSKSVSVPGTMPLNFAVGRKHNSIDL